VSKFFARKETELRARGCMLVLIEKMRKIGAIIRDNWRNVEGMWSCPERKVVK
jgi:hypothetical protein